jgi:transcription initiation factor TFIIH subunit 1
MNLCVRLNTCQSLLESSDVRLALFCSKEGAAQVRLKLSVKEEEAGHNFTFLSPQPVAYAEREKFKKDLTTIIGRNRGVSETVSRPPVTANASVEPATSVVATAVPASLSSNAPTPKLSIPPSRASTSRAPSVASDRMGTPAVPGNDHASDFRLRKKVLLSNPGLATLHKELVMSGQISEAEFWEGREVDFCFLSCITVILQLYVNESICSSPRLQRRARKRANPVR